MHKQHAFLRQPHSWSFPPTRFASSASSAFRHLAFRPFAYTLLFVVLPGLPAHGVEEEPRPTEKTIYIPFEKLQDNFEREGRGVFVPYESFQQMWEAARAHRDQPSPTGPPVQSMITRAESTAIVEGQVVRVTTRLTIELLEKGWIRVPLRLPKAAILSATIDELPARIIAEEKGGHSLLVKSKIKDTESQDGDPETEKVDLVLEYARSFSKSPGRNSVSFQPPIAPVNRWEVRVPESGVEVNVHPMLAATTVPKTDVPKTDDQPSEVDDASPPDAETVLLAFVGAASNVRIDWTPKSEGASGLQALVNVQSEQQVSVSEGAIQTNVRLVYHVSRSELSQLRISVPVGHKVVNVVDENVRQWTVENEGDAQVIHIGLFQPARKMQSVTLELEKFYDTVVSELVIPAVKALDVGRQRGIVAVRVSDELRAEPIRRVGLIQLDTTELPRRLQTPPPQFSFRFASAPFDLALRTEKVTPRIEVDQLVEVFLRPEQLTLDVLFIVDVKRAGVFEFSATVPRGFEIREVRGHKQPQVVAANIESHSLMVSDSDAPSLLKINLKSKARGQVGLYVRMEKALVDENLLTPTGKSSAFALTIPRPAGDFIARSHGTTIVYAPESLRLKPGENRGVRNISLEKAFLEIPVSCRDQFGELRPAMTLAYSDDEVELNFSVERRQPRVSVSQLMVARVDPGVISYEATFRFDIRYSSVDSLRLDVPAEFAGEMQTESDSLRELVISPPPDDVPDGYVAWRLQGDSELLGTKQIKVRWETPVSELGLGKTIELAVPRLIPQQVARSEGQIVLVKAETIDILPKGTPEGLDPIDPQHDLWHEHTVPDAAIALEFHGEWKLLLEATRYELQGLKQTSIESAVVRAVITRSRRIAAQALYRMRSNRQRLKIRLPHAVAPGGIEFDNEPLRINGRPVPLERGTDDHSFYVPLVGVANNEPFLLELRYTSPGSGGRIQIPAFPDEPAVQQVHLIPYVPQEWFYLGRRGPWTPLMRVRGNPISGQSIRPHRSDRQLIEKLGKNIDVLGDPSADFPIDGLPLVFNTLRPRPEEGELRLTLVHRNWVYALTFAAVLLWGVALVPRRFVERIIALCSVAALVILVGVFLPSLATAILNPALFIAGGLVLMLWLFTSVARHLSDWAGWWPRKKMEGGSHVQ